MKTLNFLIVAILFCVTNIFAQPSVTDIGKISLSIVMPEEIEGVSNSNINKLRTKVEQIVVSNGVSSSIVTNGFVIYPVFEIYDAQNVEGGMKNIVVVTGEMTLFIKQMDNKTIISSINTKLKGSGYSKNEAIVNLISTINIKDEKYKQFIDNGKEKILQFYSTQCPILINKSETLAKQQQYEEALGILMNIPEEAPCYSNVQNKAIEIYKSYQNNICNKQVQEAKLFISLSQYNNAIQSLFGIDPESACTDEVETLTKKIEDNLEKDRLEKLKIQMQVYRDKVDLERRRIDAIKEIAVAYYSHRPNNTVYYYQIIK